MAIRNQSTFAKGELDPALQRRTTLESFDSGLKTARNVVVAKTGRIITRNSRKYFVKSKAANQKIKTYYIPQSGRFLEFGPSYVRTYIADATKLGWGTNGFLLNEYVTPYAEADLDFLQFDSKLTPETVPTTDITYQGTSRISVIVFCKGKSPSMVYADNYPGSLSNAISVDTNFWAQLNSPSQVVANIGGTGYAVDYAFTEVVKDAESHPFFLTSNASYKFPTSNAQQNTFAIKPFSANATEIRIYRRPREGGAFGYIGSTSYSRLVVGFPEFAFSDIGGEADYAHSPPIGLSTLSYSSNMSSFKSAVGMFYQQRLITIDTLNGGEGIFASRTGFPYNFTRDYPLNATSALAFKAGTGNARVLRMIDSDGLVVFTTRGIYLNTGALAPENSALDRKGNYIIDEKIAPLAIPGAVVFVDKSTNSIRELQFSTERNKFVCPEISIFSNHLFQGRLVTSMGFQQGDLPCLFVTFNDGNFASLTYDADQQVRAWTRHDSPRLKVEQVEGTDIDNVSLFVVNRNGQRYIETTIPRFVSAAALAANPQADMSDATVFADSVMSFQSVLNDGLGAGQSFSLTPLVAGNWEGELTLTSGTSAIFTDPGPGTVGSVFRFFDPTDSSYVDLDVVARASDTSVTVQPAATFPQAYATGPKIYWCKSQFMGLGHMESEYVSVMVDGGVLSSPNNDSEEQIADVDILRVIGGVVTLPDGILGAIVHIGRPITADVETLDIATVEQRPILLESKILNKLYLDVLNSRGIFAGATFPKLNKVGDMEDVDEIPVDYDENVEGPVLGNVYEKPRTRQIEVNVQGKWSSNGRVCLRQVDPVHFEILAVALDVQDLRRQ